MIWFGYKSIYIIYIHIHTYIHTVGILFFLGHRWSELQSSQRVLPTANTPLKGPMLSLWSSNGCQNCWSTSFTHSLLEGIKIDFRYPKCRCQVPYFRLFWGLVFPQALHPGRLTWNLHITHVERKIILQTSVLMFHVNLPGRTSIQLIFFGVPDSEPF